MTIRRPAEVFPPGETIRDELEARGWSQADLAEILGRSEGLVSDLVAGKRGVTAETARGLGEAFGTGPEFWMSLDAAYQLSKVRNGGGDAVARRAGLYAKAPVRDMVRRGWIEPSTDLDVLEHRVCRFLGIADIDEEPDLPLHAARKKSAYREAPTPAQAAWLVRARQLARTLEAVPFDRAGVATAVARLRALLPAPGELGRVPRILAEAGVRFVVVEALPGSRIDGACFRDEDEGAPAIALSLRFDRLDHFWFVLFHELGHAAEGEDALDTDLVPDRTGDGRPARERAADAFAERALLPRADLDAFVARTRPYFSARAVEAFARAAGVHPAIVVGQLHHRKEVPYASLRRLLVPVRERLAASALTDGWGVVAPVAP